MGKCFLQTGLQRIDEDRAPGRSSCVFLSTFRAERFCFKRKLMINLDGTNFQLSNFTFAGVQSVSVFETVERPGESRCLNSTRLGYATNAAS